MTSNVLPLHQPIVFRDGTPQRPFADYLRSIVGAEVNSYTVRATDDAGDGTVEGDTNATDFTGQGNPPSTTSALLVGQADLCIVVHKAVAYLYGGPRNESIGVGGSYTTVAADFTPLSTADHALLINRDAADSHPQSAITDLVADQGTQDGRLSTLETRADETDTEQAAQDVLITANADKNTEQDGRLDGIDQWQSDHVDPGAVPDPHSQYTLESTALQLFAFAGYGGMRLSAPPAAFPDLGAGWQTLTVFDAVTVTPRGMTFDPVADTFVIDVDGIYVLSLSGSLSHDSSNQGRSTSIRLFDVTAGAPLGSTFPIGIGRNVTETVIPIVSLYELPDTAKGNTLRVEIGGGSTVSSVSFNALALAVWNVGEWREPLS